MARKLPVLVALGVAAAAAWVAADYRAWRSLGTGGLPPTFKGWLKTTQWRLMKRNPLAEHAEANGLHMLADLPQRAGRRPRIGPHPVPHRQLSQTADAGLRAKLKAVFDAKVSAREDVLYYQLSYFEKHNPAITLRCPECGHPDALASHGEIGHIHPSDGSMHMILSTADANAAIKAGWAERHGLAGVTLGLPSTYMMVYAPRDEAEIAVIDRLISAAIAHMSSPRDQMAV